MVPPLFPLQHNDSDNNPVDGLNRANLVALQINQVSELLPRLLIQHPFYARKLQEAGFRQPSDLASPSFDLANNLLDFQRLPFTTKAELVANQTEHPPYGELLLEPEQNYVRLHQTSGTSGQPLRWLDTPLSWECLLSSWRSLFRIAGIQPQDRLFFPFSFGPFLGFWTAFEAGCRYGCLCLPGGGMTSSARLRFLLDHRATVVFCTPTYALHLAEVARTDGVDLANSSVRAVVVAGEAGGSIPGTRSRIEQGWGARVIDHCGMTETGPLGIECEAAPGGLHLLESICWPEVVDADGKPIPPGQEGELVVTTFARSSSPLLRYRTGDLVCVDPVPCACGRALLRLSGGIRGRADDMITIRGNNVLPSKLQELLHRFSEITEYRIEVDQTSALTVLRIDLEVGLFEGQDESQDPAAYAAHTATVVKRVEKVIRDELLFRAEVRAVAPGFLPRSELKARRWHVKTN